MIYIGHIYEVLFCRVHFNGNSSGTEKLILDFLFHSPRNIATTNALDRRLYGVAGARDVDALLRDNAALFAGGELSQEEKDAFFQAVMTAYVTCKEEASKKFGPKKA